MQKNKRFTGMFMLGLVKAANKEIYGTRNYEKFDELDDADKDCYNKFAEYCNDIWDTIQSEQIIRHITGIQIYAQLWGHWDKALPWKLASENTIGVCVWLSHSLNRRFEML